MKIFTNKKFKEFMGKYDSTIESLTNEVLVLKGNTKQLRETNWELSNKNINLLAKIKKLEREIEDLKQNVRVAYVPKEEPKKEEKPTKTSKTVEKKKKSDKTTGIKEIKDKKKGKTKDGKQN